MITDIKNPNKSIYSKIENIFYFKDMTSCLNNLTDILNYLEIFNYKQEGIIYDLWIRKRIRHVI